MMAVRDRPSYVPRTWGTRWPLVARWAKDKPDRVIAYFGGSALATMAMLAVGIVASQLALVVAGLIACVVIVIEGGIYVPRAFRAMRDRH
jgi:hypothetical protein